MNRFIFNKLEFCLPVKWTERVLSAEIREFTPTPDGSNGLLQLSQFPEDVFETILKADDLGQLAAQIGCGLNSKDLSWGMAQASKQGTCDIGRYGVALFNAGEFPAMQLWITASSTTAYMWTWIGPKPFPEDCEQFVQSIMTAREYL